MSLVISDHVLSASGLEAEELLLEVIVMLFQQDKLSLGKAAESARYATDSVSTLDFSKRYLCSLRRC